MNGNQQSVGVIGLGKMGSKVAESIVNSGYKLIVYDINPKASQTLVEMGAVAVEKVVEMLNKVDIVLTSLPNTNTVKGIYEDLLKKAKPNTIFVEMSTIDPSYISELAINVSRQNCQLVDLPVSGSPDEARVGKLVLMAGGDPEIVDSIRPVINCFGEKIHYVGEPGQGKALKIVNNLMTMGNVAIAAEAFSVGMKFGIDKHLLFDVLNQSGGRSHHFSKRFPKALKRDFNGRFSVELGEKDVSIGLDLSRELNIPTPISSLVQQLYRIVESEGMGKEDIVAILKLYENWGGINKL